MSTWLVTGGAGYIGAHVVNSLIEQNFKVVIVDDLSTGLARKIPKSAIFEKLDIANTKELTAVLIKHQVDGVIHLAAKKAVGESMINPSLYYKENIGGMISLLEAMSQANVKKLFTPPAQLFMEHQKKTRYLKNLKPSRNLHTVKQS